MARKTVKEYVVWRVMGIISMATDDGEPDLEEVEKDIRRVLKHMDVNLKKGYALPDSFMEKKSD